MQVSSSETAVSRFPGLAIYYTDALKGLPQVFEQLLDTAPTLHRIVVFLHIRQVIPCSGILLLGHPSACAYVWPLFPRMEDARG